MAPRLAPALSGIAAGAVTLGTAEILALGLSRTVGTEGTPSPLLAVGGGFVDRTPPWLKDFAVATFGTADKIALFVGMGITLALVCALIGVLAVRARTAGLLLFAVVGIVGTTAVLTRPGASAPDALPTVVGTLVGLAVLAWLARGASRSEADRVTSDGLSRRGALAWGGALTVLGAAGMVVGRTLDQAAQAVATARAALGGPTAVQTVTIPADADLGVPGVAPFVSPNDGFYRIDTALSVPQLDPEEWTLRVHGLVDTEVEMSFADLLAEEMIETVVTLTCVSNEVGGDLIGNAVWTGWPIRELLERAGVQEGADMVLSTSSDGWTAGTPLEALTDDRDSILAVWMNGEPLPTQHGFPVRMVVPGLYGYVSATKWVVDLEVTRFDAAEGYWTPRGWTALGPVKVQSRIDVPTQGAQVAAGAGVVAGVAWHQHVGIERVEVRVDDGEWQEAELSGELSVDTWRQWRLDWDAPQGEHTLTVRATNQDGETQTQDQAPPAPSGATGWHTIQVSVG